ncbi:MAG: PqqD family protein [Dysgonamonadaceae bacterium]
MKLKENLILRHVGTDYIVVDPSVDEVDMTKIYSFNDSAAWLWEKLQQVEFTEDSAAVALMAYYDVEREQALSDVKQIIDFFKREGFLDE